MSRIRVVMWNRDTFDKITLEKKVKKKLPKTGWIRLKVVVEE